MLKCAVGGGGGLPGWVEGIKVCCGAIKGERDFAGNSLSYCIYASARMCVCVCARVPTSIFNACVFVCSLIQRPGESYFSISES